jgi:fructose-bisphosphate aldolase, class II
MTNQHQARAAFKRARDNHYALGAFNIDNQETLVAIVRAAKAKNSPCLVEVSHGEVQAMGLQNIRDMVDNYKKEYEVEIYLNLDHSPSVEAAMAAVDVGFEFIHIDISQERHDASYIEIVKETKQVVEYATKTGALVESEMHYFAGSSNVHKETIDYEAVKSTFTKPEEAAAFVKATGIDTLAASIGNLHGLYPVPKKLDLELLQEIRNATDCAISLHGGSGTPPHFFKDAAKIGVSKININSEMRRAFRATLEEQLKANPDEYAVMKLMGPVEDSIQHIVEAHMDVFGSSGHARV